MRCPHCADHELTAYHRSGVEVDVCMSCLGLWLDRGELEKLLGRVGSVDEVDTVAEPAGPSRSAVAAKPTRPPRRRKNRRERFLDELGDVFEDIIELDFD